MTIKFSDITGGGIPYGDTAGRPANPGVGKLYSNGQLQRLELYTGATYGWQNIVAETPGVTGYSGTVLESNTTNTITITGTNFASGATASLIGNDGTEYTANTTTVSNLTSIIATFGAISASKEPYDIRVTNPSNLYGVYYDVLTVNDTPTWNTSAGQLTSAYEGFAISTSISASDEEGSQITYSIISGALPSGVTLNSSTGVISGTAPTVSADTTYSFTAQASDGSNNSTRSFSILVQDQVAPSTVEYLVVAGGGGGGGGSAGGGGGAGGFRTGSTSVTALTPYTVTVGPGGAGKNGTLNGGERGGSGGNSVFASITSIGGGGGGGEGAGQQTGGSGGSGGGACYFSGQGPGTGTSGQGNNGGYGNTGYWAGGGGGAGAAGGNSSYGTNSAGAGGAGLSSTITGSTVWYAGGGGGATQNDNLSGGAGGIGGGGQGAMDNNTGSGPSTGGISGTPNTGGGGGGNPEGALRANVGNGGSGVVVIAYPNTNRPLTIDPSLTYDTPTRSGYRVYRFTAGTGTVTF